MEKKSFQSLLLAHQEIIHTTANILTRDKDAAADLCQETNWHALMNARKFKKGTNLNAWLKTLVRHIYYNHHRRKTLYKKIFHNLKKQKSSWANASENIDTNTFEFEDKQQISQAFHTLPVNLRIPFTLYFNGHSYKEISHLLRQPIGTVKNRIFKARKQLSTLW